MKKAVALILSILICLIVILPNFALAVDTNKYKEIYNVNKNNNGGLMDAGGKVLWVVKVIGISSGVILLIILAVKYMIASSDSSDKAKIKEKLIPYVIGAVLLFGGTALITIITNVAYSLGN